MSLKFERNLLGKLCKEHGITYQELLRKHPCKHARQAKMDITLALWRDHQLPPVVIAMLFNYTSTSQVYLAIKKHFGANCFRGYTRVAPVENNAPVTLPEAVRGILNEG